MGRHSGVAEGFAFDIAVWQHQVPVREISAQRGATVEHGDIRREHPLPGHGGEEPKAR